jgi:hypothetical protein
MPNKKIHRSGKLPEKKSQPSRGIDGTILRRILGK